VRAVRSQIPGAALALGLALTYLSLLVLVPLGGLVVRSATLSWAEFWTAVSSPRAAAAYRVTFGTAFAAAAINAVFGAVTAWVLVRYRFPGRKLLDAMVDLPFALPTAVAGIALTGLYSQQGWIGALAAAHGVKVAYTRLGIVVALIFVGLPFVVRTLQPVLQDLERELEEAAASLGATRGHTMRRVIGPAVLPALLTGFTLAFARGIGEYGSIVFISGNLPMKTEVSTLLIMTKLEQYDYGGAVAIGAVMLGLSFVLLLAINLLQGWARRGPAAAA
jgi:sulfate/thiosulfate transport system permease protein